MVFYDLGYSPHEIENHKRNLQTPILADRIVACFIDFLINLPVLFLVLSPLIQVFEKNNFYGDLSVSWQFFFAIFFIGFHVFVGSLTLQTACFGRTFGQRIMQIQIVRLFQNGHHRAPPSLWESFQRCFGYSFSLLLFGAPYLEMMIHPRRLSFYERMSNTFAISTARRFDYPPSLPEVFFAKLLLSVFCGILVLVGSIAFFERLERKKISAVMKLQEYSLLCEEISADIEHPLQRISAALAQYYVTHDDECLKKEEAAFAGTRSKMEELEPEWKSIYYLSRLITQSDKEINDEYQSEICYEEQREQSFRGWKENCILAKFFLLRLQTSEHTALKNEIIEQLLQIKDKSLVSLVILQDEYKAQKKYDLAFAYWKQINEYPNLTNELIKKQSENLAVLVYLSQMQIMTGNALPQDQRKIASVPQLMDDSLPARKKRSQSHHSVANNQISASAEQKEMFSAFEQIYGVGRGGNQAPVSERTGGFNLDSE